MNSAPALDVLFQDIELPQPILAGVLLIAIHSYSSSFNSADIGLSATRPLYYVGQMAPTMQNPPVWQVSVATHYD
jgi:hypothetical protein